MTSSNGGVHRSFAAEAAELACCTLSIYACFLGYGVLQEAIYTRRYGAQGERFTHSLFLVACQSIGNCAFAAARPTTTAQHSSGVYLARALTPQSTADLHRAFPALLCCRPQCWLC